MHNHTSHPKQQLHPTYPKGTPSLPIHRPPPRTHHSDRSSRTLSSPSTGADHLPLHAPSITISSNQSYSRLTPTPHQDSTTPHLANATPSVPLGVTVVLLSSATTTQHPDSVTPAYAAPDTDNDHPPTHSNQHSDFLRIFRTNAKYHDVQREAKEIHQARTGILPDFQATSPFFNTPDVSNLAPIMGSLQYSRYHARGGRQSRGPHRFDHEHNSPNVLNMAPGEPYRQWFHNHISYNHYSLGEATEMYNEWVLHPKYGPAPPPPPHSSNPSPPYTPPQASPPIDVHSGTPNDHSDSDHSPPAPHTANSHRHARVQTIVQDVHTSPDDSNAVLDSGAMMIIVPRRLLMTKPEWENNIRAAPPGTAIRCGNMETEPVEETSHIGSYPLSIVPNRYRTALVCVHDIVTAGHVVTFTNAETIISDVDSAYTLRIPRIPESREWRVPLHILQRLTKLRTSHPLHHPQPHNDSA